MCGKFRQRRTWQQVHDLYELLTPYIGEVATVTPMRFASVLVLDDAGKPVIRQVRWGYPRAGSDAPGNVPGHIHARAETVDTLPTFASAFRERRGLLLVESFNEGEEVTPRKTRQHTITPKDGKPLGIAVIYEHWVNEAGGELYTFAMLTTAANALVGTITDRMPAVIKAEDWDAWLHGGSKELLVPLSGDWNMVEERSRSEGKGPADLFQ